MPSRIAVSSRVRLVDVARRAGVSVAVVSAVLGRNASGGTIRAGAETAARIRSIALELGYRPNAAARQLRGARSDLLGVLIGADSTAANFKRLAAIERAAHSGGRRLMIGQFHGDPASTRSYLEDFLSRGMDAVICFHNPAPRYDRQSLDLFARFRATVFQTQCPVEGACCVDVDRADGVRQAVAHLSERGRRRIALVLNDRSANDPLMADRLKGWKAGLREAGQPAGPVWHGDGAFPPDRSSVARAVEAILCEQADALIASNDVWAIELIKGLRRAGKSVPGDLAVVGFDNLDAAELFDPALTTIDQNNTEFAEAAVELCRLVIESPRLAPRQRTQIIRPRLVVRESS